MINRRGKAIQTVCQRLLIFAALALMAGCAGVSAPRPAGVSANGYNPGEFVDGGLGPEARPAGATMASLPQNDGSLFAQQSVQWSPWRDNTAHSVGDLVTVRISVNNTAEKSASTGLSRTSKLSAGITSFFGCEAKLPGVDDDTTRAASTSPSQLIKTESTSEFDGQGDTKRTGRMVADISAQVTHVYANGNMVIHGSQSLLINSENSLLTVDGLIRPSDVTTNNIVSSDRIADARIEVTGRGVISDKQRPGILMRAFDWVWPF